MKHSETVMVSVGKLKRAVKFDIELDVEALKCEALEGAVKFRVKAFGR